VEPSVIAGLTLGYDFVREGFLGYNYPDWMKYFSVVTDFTFNRFDMREQFVDVTIAGAPVGKLFFPVWWAKTGARVEGTMACWSFLLIGKYGFFPDSEVPFGRLQPYIGVGPGLMFSSLNGMTNFYGQGLGSLSSVDITLVTETGIRYMALKNVSLDAAFRYRWTSPKYAFINPLTHLSSDVSFDADQFSALFRVSYHF
jgi:hypothetical protein